MKKIIYSILLISVLIFTTFAVAGCGDDDKNENSKTQESSSQDENNTSTNSQAADGTENIDGTTELNPTISASISSQDPATFVANKDAEKTMSTVLDHIKKGEFEKAQKLILPKQRIEPEPDLGFDDATMKKVEQILTKVEYTIINSHTISETSAIVNIKIKAADFKKVFTEYMKNVEKAQSEGFKSDKEQQNLTNNAFQKSLKDNGTKLIEKTVTVELVKKDGKWKIQDTVAFSQAVLGGVPAVSHVFFGMQ